MTGCASGVILAGGASRRMGRDKAWVQVQGQPLVERVIARLSQVCDETIVVTNNPERYQHLSVRLVQDALPERMPLVGLYSGLQAAKFEFAVVVACDMPFLNPALLKYMLTLAEGYDAIIPSAWDVRDLKARTRDHMSVKDRELHPLHAVYSKACLGPIEVQLLAGKRRVVDFYPEVNIRVVSTDEANAIDPRRLSFFNANTPELLKRAQLLSG
jgi:molybdopterin-guanine dinucleotide biosynthesis protein A